MESQKHPHMASLQKHPRWSVPHRWPCGNVGSLQACHQASMLRCPSGNVGCLQASDEACIHRCELGNVVCLEASQQARIHRCPSGNVGSLQASDQASLHCCQSGNVRFLQASDPCDDSHGVRLCGVRGLCRFRAHGRDRGGHPPAFLITETVLFGQEVPTLAMIFLTNRT